MTSQFTPGYKVNHQFLSETAVSSAERKCEVKKNIRTNKKDTGYYKVNVQMMWVIVFAGPEAVGSLLFFGVPGLLLR